MTARRTGFVSVTALAALTLTVGVFHAVAPDWSRRMGFDVWNIADADAEIRDVTAAARELHLTSGAVGRQIEAGSHVALALAEGRLTLTAATAELTRVNAGRAGFLESLRCVYGGADDDKELMVRYTMNKVAQVVFLTPREAAVLTHLKAEFRELVGKDWVN